MIGNFVGAPIGGAVNTSGTLYAQAVSAAGSGSLALTRSAGKQASLATAATVSLARAIAHALGITGPTVLTAQKVVSHHGPSISSTGTATASFAKRIQQAIAVATAGILSVSFHAGRVVMLHMTAMGSVSFGPKQIAKSITTAATGAATFVKSIGKTIATGLVASITHAFAFFRFVTKPNTIGKQITTTMARNATITSNPATGTQITTSPESETDITTSRSLPRQITT